MKQKYMMKKIAAVSLCLLMLSNICIGQVTVCDTIFNLVSPYDTPKIYTFTTVGTAGYLSGNPLGLMRRKMKQRIPTKTKVTERFLEQALWQSVIDYIEALPKQFTIRQLIIRLSFYYESTIRLQHMTRRC